MAMGHVCKIENCKNILSKTDGRICKMHRSRFSRHGTYDISPNWANLKKGIPCLTPLGYLRININGKRILHHRYIMEQSLGRILKKDERIHHKNGMTTDNRIENLELYENNAKHLRDSHRYSWKKRSDRKEYTPEIVEEIFTRYRRVKQTRWHKFPEQLCVCGKRCTTRGLCETHYQWAFRHKAIK